MIRRSFIKGAAAGAGLVLAGGGYWVATSRQRAAYWLRRIASESRRPVPPAPCKPDPGQWDDNAVTISWLGHATVLINFYGVRILTDPALGNRVGISLGIGTGGPKRHVAPALSARELPPIDLVLLSHAHMDHMDLPSLRQVRGAVSTITAKDTRDVLSRARLNSISELGWNGRVRLPFRAGDLEVEAFEVKHWGERWPSERQRGYNGYILRRGGKSLLFGGDTAFTSLFSGLAPKGPFDLAVMPIGAYNPWIWHHCTPEEALRMADAAGARYFVPIHHQTFELSKEPLSEPIERLRIALEREPERLALSRVGETFVLPRA